MWELCQWMIIIGQLVGRVRPRARKDGQMNLVKQLQKEVSRMENQLAVLRSTVAALGGNGRRQAKVPFRRKKASPLKGKPLSAAHKEAIRAGWAKRRKARS